MPPAFVHPYTAAPGGWYRGSFHGHCSQNSGCASVPLRDSVAWYAGHGADFVALTDHDRVTPLRDGPRPAGATRLWLATLNSLRGLKHCYHSEAAFRQEVWAALVLVPAALWLGQTAVERTLLAGSVLVVMIVIVMITLAGLSFVLTLSTENKAVHRQGDQLQLDEALASGMELLKAFCSQSAQLRQESGGTQDNAAVFGNLVMPGDGGARDVLQLSIVSPAADGQAGDVVRFGLQNESARLNLGVLADWERRVPGSAAAALLQLPGMSESTAAAILDWLDADGQPRPGGAEAEYYAGLGLPYEPRNGVPALLEELLLVRDVSRQALFGADAKPNSVFKGVRIGCITYSYRGGINSAEDTLKALIQDGLSEVELMGGPIQSYAGIGGPGRRRRTSPSRKSWCVSMHIM